MPAMPSELAVLNIAAICLFDMQGRLLLVRKRGTRALMLPGGKCEPGESPLDALQRELLEELELSLDANAISWLGEFSAPAANEANTRIAATLYRATLTQSVYPAAELEQLSWLDAQMPRPDTLAPLLTEQVLPALGGAWRDHAQAPVQVQPNL